MAQASPTICSSQPPSSFRNRSASMLPAAQHLRAKGQQIMRRSCGTAAPIDRRSGVAMHGRSRIIARPSTATIARPIATLLATHAWLRPVSRGNRHFTVDCGRLRQSGPRPDTRLLRQPALEGLTRSARTDSPRQVGRNKFRRHVAAAAAAHKGGGVGFWRGEGAAGIA
ncbi:hypothetical protein F511_33309 [Dorcoceras hygrometricum]|uniref:Uncharacterized protein n=1 Tax=Dorcoceras hygrometricum TaxID=472368 RepID=A0A2Z7C6V1_9LAMI|nr:hypothetical protein F511_33309 [Dorcoceras hygrometricum]